MTKPTLKLFNSLTREKEDFIPLDPSDVRVYVCGITPYDYAHIGNLRTMVVFDVLYRLLNHRYDGNVTYVRNYTDIDDKIVERAAQEGKEPFALAAEFIEIFERDMAALNISEPTEKPRVSQHMEGIVKMVDDLLQQGFAYVTPSGDVMFDVPRFNQLGKPHDNFGYIARRKFDNVQARVEEDLEKLDSRDFPVWKANAKSATKMEQAFLPRELGATYPGFSAPGRPGWHIECSAMSESLLGKAYKPGDKALFDIHGGGEDLAFPHHSCEIAQTEALHPTCTMSSIWMHAAFLTVNGQKMSKSLNNFLRVEDALKKYSPEAIRLWLLQTHYRKPVDYSDEALQAAETRLLRIIRGLPELETDALEDISQAYEFSEAEKYKFENFFTALQDDLNTPKALAVLSEMEAMINVNYYSNDLNETSKAFAAKLTLAVIDLYKEILGIDLIAFADIEKSKRNSMSEEAKILYEARSIARANKNWAESDRLRDILKNEHGIIVEDGIAGREWRRL